MEKDPDQLLETYTRVREKRDLGIAILVNYDADIKAHNKELKRFDKYIDKLIDEINRYYGLYHNLKKTKLALSNHNEVEKLRREYADFLTQ